MMPKQKPLTLPCLAAGLLLGCVFLPSSAAAKGVAPDAPNAPSTDNSPVPAHKLPAVPPLVGPQSPLLQLGLVIPTPRPDIQATGAQEIQGAQADSADPAAPAEAPAARASAQPAPAEADATATPTPAQPDASARAPHSDVELNEQTYQAVAGLATVSTALPATFTLPARISLNVPLAPPADDSPSAPLPPIALSPVPRSVDLPVAVAISVDLPPWTGGVASTDLPPAAQKGHDGVILPLQLAFDVTLDPPSEESVTTAALPAPMATANLTPAPPHDQVTTVALNQPAGQIASDALPLVEPRPKPQSKIGPAQSVRAPAEAAPLVFKLRR
jgi:hypothetical protein